MGALEVLFIIIIIIKRYSLSPISVHLSTYAVTALREACELIRPWKQQGIEART